MSKVLEFHVKSNEKCLVGTQMSIKMRIDVQECNNSTNAQVKNRKIKSSARRETTSEAKGEDYAAKRPRTRNFFAGQDFG